MNRRTLWVFFVPALIAVALGPTVTSVTSGGGASHVLVSAAPFAETDVDDIRLAEAPPMVDSQWQWTSGWRGTTARDPHVMSYDATRATSLVGEAWQYDAVESPAPPFRDRATAYDADRVVVVLFGGDSASTETRMYDGQSWTLHRVPGPPPRSLPATVYDAARKTVVLFGSDRPARPFNYLGDLRDLDEQR